MPEKIGISELALNAVQPLQTLAHGKDVTLPLQLPASRVVADKNTIQAVLRNPVNNSIKFTESGGEVTVGCSDRPDGKLDIYVKDSGTGMSADLIQKIKSGIHTQSTPGTSHKTRTGLGLRICGKFLAEHDSVKEIDSEPGEGSTFRFALEKAQASNVKHCRYGCMV